MNLKLTCRTSLDKSNSKIWSSVDLRVHTNSSAFSFHALLCVTLPDDYFCGTSMAGGSMVCPEGSRIRRQRDLMACYVTVQTAVTSVTSLTSSVFSCRQDVIFNVSIKSGLNFLFFPVMFFWTDDGWMKESAEMCAHIVIRIRLYKYTHYTGNASLVESDYELHT